MNLNPNIIMAGQQPDIVNALARSSQAAGLTNRVRRDNRLNQLYQEQGAGLLSGDQNALNALAAQDPRQALQFQQVHQQNERQARQDALSEQEFAFRIQKWAQQATDAEAAKEAEEYKTLVHMAATAETPEQWDQIVTQYGGDDGQELIGQFGNRDALLGKYMTAAQIIEQSKPPKPADEYGRYAAEERAAGREPMSRIEFKRAGKLKQQIEVTPDGGVKLTESFGNEGAKPPKLTVDAAKNTGFLIRTKEANKVLSDLEEQGTRFGQQMLENVPFGLGNFGRDPEFQKFDQARRDFVNAILRRESGAVISDQEFDNANKQYFPVPGDSPEVIEQKRQNRINAIRGLEVGSGEGAGFVERQDAERESAIPDFKAMSDEELDAWIAENDQ